MSEKLIGKISHYFNHLGVAVLKLEAESLQVGETIHIVGKAHDFSQVVTSLQVDKEAVVGLAQGDEGALKVEYPVHEGDKVYLVE